MSSLFDGRMASNLHSNLYREAALSPLPLAFPSEGFRILVEKGERGDASEEAVMNGESARHNGYYTSLTRNMVIVMILVSVTPLVLISGTIFYYFETSYHEKALEHLKVLVRKHRRNVDTFLEEKLANIKVLAKSYPFEQLADEKFLNERLTLLQQTYGRSFVDLGVVNEQGIQIAYAGPFRLRKADYSKAEWFKEAMLKDSYISDVFHGLRGLPHFLIAVRGEHQGQKWILRATVDFEAFNGMVESIRIGSTGFAFILNHKGEFQTKPRFEVMPSKDIYLDFLKRRQASPTEASSDDVFSVEEDDEKGTRTIYLMSLLKTGDWLLAYQQSAEDAYSVLHHARRVTIAIFLLGLSGIVMVTVYLARRMVRRIRVADLQKEMMNEQVIEAGKLASVGELAAGIAHEINNPVAIMMEEAGWIEDLLMEEDLKETANLDEFKRALTQIRTQGKRCKEITHKLLSFARKTDPVVKHIQLNDLIEEVVALSQQRAKYANVKIVTELKEDLPDVSVSPSEVQQVLLNLINNSLDAMDGKGGTVEVTTRIDEPYVVVDVADQGTGIPQANLARVFDPFFTTKPVGKGTGLGLSICYGIIKKMGGEISVNSAVGIGTTFHIRIPLSKEDNSES